MSIMKDEIQKALAESKARFETAHCKLRTLTDVMIPWEDVESEIQRRGGSTFSNLEALLADVAAGKWPSERAD